MEISAVLNALRTASCRDRKSLWSFSVNNLFLATLLLGISGLFFWCVMGILLLFPLMSDPLQKIPEKRLKLCPLTNRERIALHWLSPWLNPMTWILAIIALWAATQRMPLFAGVVLLIPVAGIFASRIPTGAIWSLWHIVLHRDSWVLLFLKTCGRCVRHWISGQRSCLAVPAFSTACSYGNCWATP